MSTRGHASSSIELFAFKLAHMGNKLGHAWRHTRLWVKQWWGRGRVNLWFRTLFRGLNYDTWRTKGKIYKQNDSKNSFEIRYLMSHNSVLSPSWMSDQHVLVRNIGTNCSARPAWHNQMQHNPIRNDSIIPKMNCIKSLRSRIPGDISGKDMN